MLVPSIGAFFSEPAKYPAQGFEVVELLAASLTKENDDGDTPESLAGYAPVGSLLDHFVDAVFAPRRNPLHVVNFLECLLSQGFRCTVSGLIHFDKPLLGGPEDNRIVTAPAVRIAVLVGVMPQQRTPIAQELYDDRICGENVFAFVFGQALEVDAVIIERSVNFEPILLAGNKVIRAVTGSGVNDTTSLIEGDVIGQKSGHLKR